MSLPMYCRRCALLALKQCRSPSIPSSLLNPIYLHPLCRHCPWNGRHFCSSSVAAWFRELLSKPNPFSRRNVLVFNLGVYHRAQEMSISSFAVYCHELRALIQSMHDWSSVALSAAPLVFVYLPPAIHGFRGPFMTIVNDARYSQVMYSVFREPVGNLHFHFLDAFTLSLSRADSSDLDGMHYRSSSVTRMIANILLTLICAHATNSSFNLLEAVE